MKEIEILEVVTNTDKATITLTISSKLCESDVKLKCPTVEDLKQSWKAYLIPNRKSKSHFRK